MLHFPLLFLFWIMLALSHSPGQIPPMKISLDGHWLFKVDPEKVGVDNKWYAEETDRSAWQTAQVPNFWKEYPGLAAYDGWGWYAKRFVFETTAEPMSLHFSGVDDDAVVWLNGREVGSHTGWSDPFAVDLTQTLRNGENLVVVQVMDHGGGGGIYKPITLVETNQLDEVIKSQYFGKPALKSPDWVRDAVIYEVYLRSFSREGTFEGLEKRVPELKDLGVTVLWLMPIHPIGVEKRKGILGSPYSVKDFYGINPEFGTMRDFRKLVNTVHNNGIKLIIDFVANHTAWDCALIEDHPEWFTKDVDGNIIPPNDDWTDVADLDYSQPELRKYMIEVMRYWVRDVGVDGFRCDVAELVPTDFWEEARRQLDKIKPVMLLSEGSLPEHHMRAFDLTYSWTIYDALDPLLKGKRPATLLDEIFRKEYLRFPTGALRMRFNTNHDKNAWDAPAVLKFGPEGLRLSAVLINTIPGVPMIYTGEEVANDKELGLFEKVEVEWNTSSDMRELYKKLFHLRKKHKALSRGEMIRAVSSQDQDVYAFVRVAGYDKVLVVLNFASEPRYASISAPMERIFPGRERVTMKDIFTDSRVEITTESGPQATLTLEPYGYRVFVLLDELREVEYY